MLAMPPSDVIVAPAPTSYQEAQQLLISVATKGYFTSTSKLTFLLSGKVTSAKEVADGQYLYGAIRQVSLGMGRLMQMARNAPGSAVQFSLEPGKKFTMRVSGAPTAAVCDGVRRMWVGGLWESAGVISQRQARGNPLAMFKLAGDQNFNGFTPQNVNYAASKLFSAHARIKMPDGRLAPIATSVDWQITPSIMTCLVGHMTATNGNVYLPYFSGGEAPGVFKP